MSNYFQLFDRYLNNLGNICHKIELADADGNIFNQRLHPDMLPFINQVKTTCNFAIRGCAPFVGEPVISFNQEQNTWQSLQQQINATRQHLAALSNKEIYEGKCSEQAGFAKVELNSREFMELYIIPNFFFHLTTVYAIARASNIAISKGDFDGFHSYPEGFCFEK